LTPARSKGSEASGPATSLLARQRAESKQAVFRHFQASPAPGQVFTVIFAAIAAASLFVRRKNTPESLESAQLKNSVAQFLKQFPGYAGGAISRLAHWANRECGKDQLHPPSTAEIAPILAIFPVRRQPTISLRNCAFPPFDSLPLHRIVAEP
jgi:hypothetical protein